VTSWWIEPVVPVDRWWWFAGVLIGTTLLTVLFSPHRRRAMGAIRLAAAHGSSVAVPLAGVFVVRSGFRHAYVLEGRGWWEAMWLSLLWMMGFIVIGQALVTRVPPTSGLIRDLRQTSKNMWMGRLNRLLGISR
jgi:hypothetical protein